MDSVLICLCQKGVWFQEMYPWMGVGMLFVLFIYLFFASDQKSIKARANTQTDKYTKYPPYTLIEPTQHMWQKLSLSGPTLLSLAQPQSSDLGFK